MVAHKGEKKTEKKTEKRDKYESKFCENDMTFDECELSILRNAVNEGEMIENKKLVNDPQIKKMLSILEKFLQRGKNMCYGGIALNAVLPKDSQFYDFDNELPDYDFFSPNAVKDALDLCDLYHRAGFEMVEARSGVHHGTYKVYVNYVAMADITQMDPVYFNYMMEEAVKIKNIYYSPIHFLRMALFIELSRPKGDISRWEKVFKRLTLLNKYYPLKSEIPCELVEIQRSMTRVSKLETSLEEISKKNQSKKDDTEKMEKILLSTLEERKVQQTEIYKIVRDVLIEKGVVFFGGYATSLYADRMPEKERQWVEQIPDFDVLSEKSEECAKAVVEKLKKAGFESVKMIENPSLGEYIPRNFQIVVFEKENICFIHEPLACHSYNTIPKNGKKIKVATIDTILSLYLAFLYSGKDYVYRERILCISQFLFEVEEKNRLEQNGLLKRFTMECVGKQHSMIDIIQEKSAKFEELKNQKNTAEYTSWFLKYNPAKDKKPVISDVSSVSNIKKQNPKPYQVKKTTIKTMKKRVFMKKTKTHRKHKNHKKGDFLFG